MTGSSQLTSSHHSTLHFLHASLALIVVVLLILSAVSGPSTKYWWMTVEYSNVGNLVNRGNPTVGTSTTWNLGGLGACQVGERFVPPPGYV